MKLDKIVDADSHVLEPSDLWEENLEPEYRDRALRILKDENGLEYLSIGGQKPKALLNQGGTFARMGAVGKDLRQYMTPGKFDYEQARIPEIIDPLRRAKVMDQYEIDISILYPTLGVCWESECTDAKLAAAHCRVYNNWIVNHCKPCPDRFIPIGQISLLDVDEGVQELRRVAGMGVKGVVINPAPSNDIPLGNPHYDPFWAEVGGLDLPVSMHVINNADYPGSRWHPDGLSISVWYFIAMSMLHDIMITFTTLFEDNLFHRFPGVKLALMETGCGWLAHWLDRLDSLYDHFGFTTKMELRPSEYFQRQCWISMDPDERMAPAVINQVGADKFMWAADYPHSEAHLGVVREIKETLSPLSEEQRRKVIGENAIELYKLT